MNNFKKISQMLFLGIYMFSCNVLEQSPSEYKVIYNGNGFDQGVVPVDDNYYLKGEVAIILDNTGNLLLNGYEFSGWTVDDSYEIYQLGDFLILGGSDIMLNANWSKTFIVTFETNGGSEVNEQEITTGFTMTKPDNPFKDGYVFMGWFDQTYTEKFYFDGLNINSDITLWALWQKIYTIGDIGPAGGYIFYDDEEDNIDDIIGYRYLEVTQEDYSEKLAWGSYTDANVSNDILIGASGVALGTGYQNTQIIISEDDRSNKPADICSEYSLVINGKEFNDWFLPSKDELLLMKKNLLLLGYTGFDGKNYWSSSEENPNNAWAVVDQSYWGKWDGDYPEYGLTISYKAYLRYFRPVRAF